MAETDLYRGLPENHCQIISNRRLKFSHVSVSLLKKVHNYEMLCSEIEDLPQVLLHLMQNDVITEEELNKVNSEERRRRGVAALLEILLKRTTEPWLEIFLDCLEKTGQRHVIDRLKRRTPPNSPSAIPALRKKDYMQRVMLFEEDAEDAMRRKYDCELVKATRDILNSDIISIIKGSIVFILDPSSEKAIEDLWQRNPGSQKIGKFLHMILNDYECKEKFTERRIIRVELTEELNAFHCRVQKSSHMCYDYVLDTSPYSCSECFRITVLECYESLLDEIETKMILKTFHGKDEIVPDFIKKACIYEKEKRSRKERAEIFLQCILRHEQLLMDFKNIFHATSKFRMPLVTCEAHGGDSTEKLHLREKIVLHFEMHFNRSENTVIVNSLSKRMDNLLKDATEYQLSDEKVQRLILELVAAEKGDMPNKGICLSCHLIETATMKSALLHGVCDVLISENYTDKLKMLVQRLEAIEDVRNRLVFSPLSVSAEDLSVYQENYRLTFVDVESNDSNSLINSKKKCFMTGDSMTTILIKLIIENGIQQNKDGSLRCLQDTTHSTHSKEDLNGEFDETRIILVGLSYGKTMIANQLLNSGILKWDKPDRETKRETYNDRHFKKKIVVTSIPDMRFEFRQEREVIKQIGKATFMTAPGPHAVMLVVQDSHVDEVELDEMVQSIIHVFGESVLPYIIVSVIGNVQTDKTMLKKWKGSRYIQDIVRKGRVVYMKNEAHNFSCRNSLVDRILEIIEQIPKTMGKSHFINASFEKAEEILRRETLNISKTYQEDYKRHEIATATFKARMTPHQIFKKRILNSNPREEVFKNLDKVIDLDFLDCLYMTM